jgi:DNA-binding NarL/FixJ family response regulator
MHNSLRVLLVDDNPYFLAAAEDFLELWKQFEVVGTASEGQQALAKARAIQPDVILLDLNLQGQSGLELISDFKREVRGIIVIILTIQEESVYRTAAMQAGADGFISKANMQSELLPLLECFQLNRLNERLE